MKATGTLITDYKQYVLIILLPAQGFLKVWPKDRLNQNHVRCLAESENYGPHSRLLNLLSENGASESTHLSNYRGNSYALQNLRPPVLNENNVQHRYVVQRI